MEIFLKKIILPTCKSLLKVSRKIYKTQKLGNFLIQYIGVYQTNHKCSYLHALMCFLLSWGLQCSYNLPDDNCHRQVHKLIHSYNMSRWVCYKSVWGAAGWSVITGTTELFCNVQPLLSRLRHVKSSCFHCVTCRWTLSAW